MCVCVCVCAIVIRGGEVTYCASFQVELAAKRIPSRTTSTVVARFSNRTLWTGGMLSMTDSAPASGGPSVVDSNIGLCYTAGAQALSEKKRTGAWKRALTWVPFLQRKYDGSRWCQFSGPRRTS